MSFVEEQEIQIFGARLPNSWFSKYLTLLSGLQKFPLLVRYPRVPLNYFNNIQEHCQKSIFKLRQVQNFTYASNVFRAKLLFRVDILKITRYLQKVLLPKWFSSFCHMLLLQIGL